MIINDISSINSAAEITLDAIEGKYYNIDKIFSSYSGLLSSSTGALKIKIGGSEVFNIDIKAGGIVSEYPSFSSGENQEVVITLTGIIGMISKLNVLYTIYNA